MKVEFNTSTYQISHGRNPSGTGMWGFAANRYPDSLDPSIIWANMKYADAKRHAASIARERGVATLFVLP